MIWWKRLTCWYCGSDRCGHKDVDELYTSRYFFHNVSQAGFLRHKGVVPDEQETDGKEKA